MSRVFLYVGDGIGELELQALALARQLGTVEAVSLGEASVGGVALAWQLHHSLLTDYVPEAIAEALAQLVGAEMPDAVIAVGSERGKEVMAHLAALLDLPLATNVVTVDTTDDDWQLTRVRWGGSLLEEARLTAFLKLLTVAPHSHPLAESDGVAPAKRFEPDLAESLARTRVVERVEVEQGITLTTAPVVVSGGRGVGSPEGFAVLEELAKLIGGQWAARGL